MIDIYRGDDDEERAEYRRRLESLRSPDSLPLVQDLRVDPNGNVWLETYALPGRDPRSHARRSGVPVESGPSPWIVLDPEGRLLGTVRMPMGLEVLEIGSAHVLGLWRDELGVERVRRHAVLKDPPSP